MVERLEHNKSVDSILETEPNFIETPSMPVFDTLLRIKEDYKRSSFPNADSVVNLLDEALIKIRTKSLYKTDASAFEPSLFNDPNQSMQVSWLNEYSTGALDIEHKHVLETTKQGISIIEQQSPLPNKRNKSITYVLELVSKYDPQLKLVRDHCGFNIHRCFE